MVVSNAVTALQWERHAAAVAAEQAASVRTQRLVERAGGVERLEAIVERFEAMLALGASR